MAEREFKNASALGFNGANHGSSLVLSQFAHPQMSLSSINWPSIAYPSGNDSQTLEEVRSSLRQKREDGCPVAAVLIEPTNWQSGHVASHDFIV